MRKAKAKLSKEEQILLGIEFLGLGYKYCICDDREVHSIISKKNSRMSTDELAELLDSMSGTEAESSDDRIESSSRKYRQYANEVNSIGVRIEAELGRKRLIGFEESILKLTSFYAKSHCHEYSDEAIKLFIKNRKSKSIKDNQYYSLYYLILVRYATKHKFPIQFEYHNYNDHKKIKDRKVLPLGMSCKANHFFLFGVDLETGETKRFLFSCINEMYTDLEEAYSFPDLMNNSKMKFPPNIGRFLAEEYPSEATNEPIDFKIEFYGYSHRRLLKTYAFESIVEIDSNPKDGKSIYVISTKNTESLFAMLFAIGTTCKLISPAIWINKYQERLKSIQRQYQGLN